MSQADANEPEGNQPKHRNALQGRPERQDDDEEHHGENQRHH